MIDPDARVTPSISSISPIRSRESGSMPKPPMLPGSADDHFVPVVLDSTVDEEL
jgi:hypothetical protein